MQQTVAHKGELDAVTLFWLPFLKDFLIVTPDPTCTFSLLITQLFQRGYYTLFPDLETDAYRGNQSTSNS